MVTLPFNVGDEYNLFCKDTGELYHCRVIQDNKDGTATIEVEGEQDTSSAPKWLLQSWAEEAEAAGYPVILILGDPVEVVNDLPDERNTSDSYNKSTPKQTFKDWIGGIGCFIVFLLLISTCAYHSYKSGRARRERKEFIADSIAKRKQYVKDSIDSVHNSPEYKVYMDSLHVVRKKERENEEKSTIVLVCAGDSVYHFMTQCFVISNIGKIKTMSEYDAKKAGLKECYDCVRDLDGYIHEEDISEYICDYYDKGDIIELFNITSDDL